MLTSYYDSGKLAYYGKSTDTKPTVYEAVLGIQKAIPNGSTLYEFDTKKVYIFDAETKTWIMQ